MAEAAPQHLELPWGLLELCALLGPPRDSLRGPEQGAQKKGAKSPPSLAPEVLSVFVPPFVSKEDSAAAAAAAGASSGTLGKAKRRSFRRKRDRPRAEPGRGPRGAEPEDAGIPDGVDLLALPQLCFPGGVRVASEPEEDRVHFLVLTDVCGNRTHGVVAQYYRPLHDKHCFYNGKTQWEASGPSGSAAGCFVPFAVCVVSRFPYYNALKDCLSCLLTHLKLCKDFEVDNHIKDFAAKLSLIPSPPPGPLHLVFNMKPLQIVFPSRADPESPLIDLDLHLPLLCFRPEKVLQILTCLLTERRLVFFSSSWALLTLVAECFMAFLHPLQWQHTFVPILSGQMLDFVMAPTSFLMGCHLDHFAEVSKEADGLILINIDTGSISSSNSEDADVPDIPLLAAQTFIQSIQSLQLHHELHLAHLCASTDLNEGRASRRAWQHRLNCQIQQICLQLLVSIFREVKNHLNYEHRVFNSEEFLKTRAPGDQQFYKQVLETYMFHAFLKARLSRRMDAFAQMELHTQSEEDRINGTLLSPRRPTIEKMASRKSTLLQAAPRRKVVSMPDLQVIAVPELLPRNSSLRKIHTADGGSSHAGQQKQIDPETFREFYNCWKEAEAEAQEVSLPLSALEHLDKNECVYKLSSSVKTNLGVGKIAMTQKRLFLLTEGRPGYVEIAAFRDMEEVRSTTVAFLLLRIPTLKIKTASKKEVFEANLKTECDLWHLMVKEMWAGKKLADEHKDPQYVQQALTHVLLMDAVVGTLQSPGAIYAASKLSHFDKLRSEMPMVVPKTTSETLKHKINPSAGETAPRAVDVLLYTPGHLDPAEKVEDAHPKLWCALNGGKVVVFDASSWTIHQHCLKVGNSKLNCMVMVEQSQVWVGSEDSVIYIINVHSMSCHKQLTDHRASVTGLVVQDGAPSAVYSCSADGTVLAWNVSSLRVTSRFQVPGNGLSSITLYGDRLWCCAGSSIVVMTASGFLHQELKINEGFKDRSAFLAFQLLHEQEQLWAACSRYDSIYVWSLEDLARPPQRVCLRDCSAITCMIRVKQQIWVGGTGLSQGRPKGKIYVIDAERRTVEKELVAHADTVKTLCSAEDRYVLSGSGCEEGKIAIWKVE
ncbi:DENN domain-containing protein 3 isoform X4 [Phacochoerus africanus]|uniref:DENN domain-containing protein 3 isoform X4 n=1 Tax=Phacochoerus africanus TaxID=41426 RepID=UPI001FD92315|nr:DENN domain-containing protein 3 isoform X4 [Phacochoerus africanus]